MRRSGLQARLRRVALGEGATAVDGRDEAPGRHRRYRWPAGVAVAAAVILGAAVAMTAMPGQGGRSERVAIDTPGSPPTSAVTGSAATPLLDEALSVWDGFPAAASRRPLVLIEGAVNDPAGGFSTGAMKEAYAQGFINLPPQLPKSPATLDGYPLATAAQALSRLTTPSSAGQVIQVPSLQVSSVLLGSAGFRTDRGTIELPAWLVSIAGVTNPAAVLAVAPSAIFAPPVTNFHAPGVPSAGAADLGRDHETLTVHLAGAAAGTGPCTADYSIQIATSHHAVAVQIVTHSHDTAGMACAAVAYPRQVTAKLPSPLGNRVLVDAASRTAVIVNVTP